jgi:hypothetical protein
MRARGHRFPHGVKVAGSLLAVPGFVKYRDQRLDEARRGLDDIHAMQELGSDEE